MQEPFLYAKLNLLMIMKNNILQSIPYLFGQDFHPNKCRIFGNKDRT